MTVDRTPLEVGAIVSCVVERIEQYGAWVRVPGVDAKAIILIPEIQWGRVRDVGDHFAVGDAVDAMVLRHNLESKALSLSTKRMLEDPWARHQESLVVGTALDGRVMRATDYGVFVELFEDIDGLVHLDVLRGRGFDGHPRDAAAVGDPMSVRIVSIDRPLRRIGLDLT